MVHCSLRDSELAYTQYMWAELRHRMALIGQRSYLEAVRKINMTKKIAILHDPIGDGVLPL